MNKELILHIALFFILIFAQVLIFNNMAIPKFGYIPYVYVLFILLYPVKYNKILLIFISFLLGLSIDIFSNSGGIHAASCLVITYIRPFILKFSFGTSYEFHHIKFKNTDLTQRISYFAILIFIHHIFLFFLEVGNFSFIKYTTSNIVFSGLYTLILSLILHSLFSKQKR